MKQVQILYGSDRGKNKNDAPFVMLYDPPSWPLRTQQRRGYDRMKIVYQRLVTESESNWLKEQFRCAAMYYHDVEKLIEDEEDEIGSSDEKIQLLRKIKREIQ